MKIDPEHCQDFLPAEMTLLLVFEQDASAFKADGGVAALHEDAIWRVGVAERALLIDYQLAVHLLLDLLDEL